MIEQPFDLQKVAQHCATGKLIADNLAHMNIEALSHAQLAARLREVTAMYADACAIIVKLIEYYS